MRRKIVIVPLILSMLLLTLTYVAFVRAIPQEKRTYRLEYAGLTVNIEAPYQVYPGENITVTVRAEAPRGEIYVEYIHVEICGLKNETDEISLRNIIHLEKSPLIDPHQDDYVVIIPNYTSPGLTYGILSCKWEFMGAPEKIPPTGFILTYVKSLELEELQAAYDSLLANYTKLKNYKSELGSTRNLMYIFVATTVVSAATAFILLIRRPKRLWA